MQMSMFSSEELPVRASASLDSERDWMIRVATSRSRISQFWIDTAPAGAAGRTSPASCRREADGTLVPFSEAWGNSGMASAGQALTLSTSTWRNGAVVCSLSDTLETGDVPRRFYLTARACRGILRRAEKRGKALPAPLARTSAGGGFGGDFETTGGLIPDVVGTLSDGAHMGGSLTAKTPTQAASLPSVSLCLNAGAMGRIDAESETLIPIGGFFDPIGLDSELNAVVDGAGPLKVLSRSGGGVAGMVAHSLRAEGHDASEDGTGRGTPIVPIAFSTKDYGADAGDLAPTLRSGGHDKSHANGGVMPAVAFTNQWGDESEHAFSTLKSSCHGALPMVQQQMAVRRLTPVECARLQGFPDDYLDILYRGKPAADGPKYKALGNSFAVPVVSWIGRRIQMVEDLCSSVKAAS